MSDPRDVTGRWSGIYNYPRGLPPNPFTAILQETGGSFTGETIEPSPSPGYGGREAHALLQGSRSGATISFVKHYDAEHRVDTPVSYSGTISADGEEITGRWDIPGMWSGTFIMVRDGGRGEEVEQRTAETVR